MHIAFITPFCPTPADTGGKLRSAALIRALARQHDVHVYVLRAPVGRGAVDGVEYVGLGAPDRASLAARLPGGAPRTLRSYWSRPACRRLQNVLADCPPQVVIADELCTAPYAARVAAPRLLLRQKIDSQFYDAVARRRRGPHRWLAGLEARTLRASERTFARQFALGVVCSSADARRARRIQPNLPQRVVPNGVDSDQYAHLPPEPAELVITFIGALDYFPNVDAVCWLVDELLPAIRAQAPAARLQIVGRAPGRAVRALAARPGVTIVGPTPDVRPYLAASQVFLAPLRIGGGTRIKILQALAARRAVVATSVAAEGLALQHEKHLFLADTARDLVAQTVALLRQPARRAELAAGGQAQVREHYDWRIIGPQLAALCEEVVQQA